MDRCVRHISNRICRAVVTKDRWRPGVRNGIGDLAPIDDRSPILLCDGDQPVAAGLKVTESVRSRFAYRDSLSCLIWANMFAGNEALQDYRPASKGGH